MSVGATVCSAQNLGATVPILREYAAGRAIYFAQDEDNGLVFESQVGGGGSNVQVYVKLSPIGDAIQSKIEYWTDNAGRPHALSVLWLQIDYNRMLTVMRYPYGYAYGSERPLPYGVSTVAVTGVLDSQTLRIPYVKLSMQLDKLSERLQSEYDSANRLAGADPAVALLKTKYASYWSEKLEAARISLRELDSAMQSVPFKAPAGWIWPRSSGSYHVDGLSGLDAPYGGSEFREVSRERGVIRFAPGPGSERPEALIQSFVDPAGMTPAVSANIREKEGAAASAIDAAVRLCNDLFSPPCS